jgi:hypothetical protein
MGSYTAIPQTPTYRAATTANVVIAQNNEIFFLISGSATRDVIVEKITFSGGTLTAVAYNSLVVEKFSTAASGGTATALTKTPLNSLSAASTVNTCQVYTAAPTEGTLVGTIACRRVLLQSTTAAAGGTPEAYEFDFTDVDGGGVVLHGVAQGLGLAFSTDPASDVTAGIEVQWKEA